MLSSLAHAGWDRDEVIRVGSLEIRPRQGLARGGGIVRREDLYPSVHISLIPPRHAANARGA